VTRYHIRLDAAAGPGPADASLLEVAVDETPAGLRASVVARPRVASTARPSASDEAAGMREGDRVDVAEVLPGWYSILINGRSHTAGIATWRAGAAASGYGGAGPRRWTLVFDGEAVSVDVARSARGRAGLQTAAGGAAGQVRAPMPGLIVAIQAGPGTAVAEGETLIIMEAMKMQMEIRAPHAGVVREVRVHPGQDVAGSDVLAVLE
jgi:biotin carboxyl carrier protein